MKKIAFCFLIKDTLYNQDFWKNYLSNIDQSSYEIYIHYKNKPNIILDKYKFVKCIQTKWGDISLVRASIILFNNAFKDNCDIAFLLSEDSLPIVPYHILYEIDSSIFSVQSANYGIYREHKYRNFRSLDTYFQNQIDKTKWKKQNMFFCITKNDFLEINKHDYTDNFKHLGVPDEYYFINLFIYYKLNYEDGKYMFVDLNETKTQAYQQAIPNYIFNKYEKIIKSYYFCRKIYHYNQIDYMTYLLNNNHKNKDIYKNKDIDN